MSSWARKAVTTPVELKSVLSLRLIGRRNILFWDRRGIRAEVRRKGRLEEWEESAASKRQVILLWRSSHTVVECKLREQTSQNRPPMNERSKPVKGKGNRKDWWLVINGDCFLNSSFVIRYSSFVIRHQQWVVKIEIIFFGLTWWEGSVMETSLPSPASCKSIKEWFSKINGGGDRGISSICQLSSAASGAVTRHCKRYGYSWIRQQETCHYSYWDSSVLTVWVRTTRVWDSVREIGVLSLPFSEHRSVRDHSSFTGNPETRNASVELASIFYSLGYPFHLEEFSFRGIFIFI